MSMHKIAFFNLDLGEGFTETLSDIIWDDDAGPFENIFRWANRLLILSGGGKAIVLSILYFMDIGLDDIGKILDKRYSLSQLSDIVNIDASSAGQDIAETLWNSIEDKVSAEKKNSLIALGAYSPADKIKLLVEFDKSKSSKAQFAAKHNIAPSTFKGWFAARAAGRLKAGPKSKMKMSPVDKKPAKKTPVKKPTKKVTEKKVPTKVKSEPKVSSSKPVKERKLTTWQKTRLEKEERQEAAQERARMQKGKERRDDKRISRDREDRNEKDKRDREERESVRKTDQRRDENIRKDRQLERDDIKRRDDVSQKKTLDDEREIDNKRKDKQNKKDQRRQTRVDIKKEKLNYKRMLNVEKMRAGGKRPTMGGLRRLGGKAALGAALAGIIGGAIKLATSSSWLSRGLRAGGIIGAETIQKSPSSTRTRERATEQQDTKLNETEQIIEQIFS